MIAVDTNVLLRYLVQDDEVQAALAASFLEQQLSPGDPGFVSLVVMCELVWALRKTYGQPRGVIASSLAALVNTPQLALESVETVEAAIAHGSGDIADSIIHLIGRSAGCMTTVTFDRKFARLPGVELLA